MSQPVPSAVDQTHGADPIGQTTQQSSTSLVSARGRLQRLHGFETILGYLEVMMFSETQ